MAIQTDDFQDRGGARSAGPASARVVSAAPASPNEEAIERVSEAGPSVPVEPMCPACGFGDGDASGWR